MIWLHSVNLRGASENCLALGKSRKPLATQK